MSLFVLGKRLGCLGDQMPQESKDFVKDVHEINAVSSDMLFGFPFHKIWRDKKWRQLVNSSAGTINYTMRHINLKVKEIEEQRKRSAAGDDHQPELGMDFLTYMIYSGNVSVQDVSLDAADLLVAGVDTVRVI